jgi:hypothetical protein
MMPVVCKKFDPSSRIIQLVHILCSCLTFEARDYVCTRIKEEFPQIDSDIAEHDSPYDDAHGGVIYWIHINYPEAYPFATGVIGFCGPWVMTAEEAKNLVDERPYLYQGRSLNLLVEGK